MTQTQTHLGSLEGSMSRDVFALHVFLTRLLALIIVNEYHLTCFGPARQEFGLVLDQNDDMIRKSNASLGLNDIRAG